MRGISVDAVRSAVGGLGSELMTQMNREGSAAQRTGFIARLDAGTVKLGAGTTSSELCKTMAARVAASIKSKTQP
jgi:hypothetical protein